MIETAGRQDLAAWTGTADPEHGRQPDNLIVRIVNVLWSHSGAIGFYSLLTETGAFESKWKVRDFLFLLIRARVVEETLSRRYRLSADARRRMS